MPTQVKQKQAAKPQAPTSTADQAKAIADAQALARKEDLRVACNKSCSELSRVIHPKTYKDSDGNDYTVYTRKAHRAQEQPDGTFKAVETGRVTLPPASALPESVSAEERLAWNKVKRDMAHRMVLHPGMTVDAIGLGRDSTGRNRGIIRVIETAVPVQAQSGEKLLESVQEQLATVEL